MSGPEFVSEPLTPDPLSFDLAAMAIGLPGLPSGFTWRGRHFDVATVLSTWKESEGCTHGGGERYLRKHFWKVRATSGETLTIYAVRKVKRGESAKQRWWLYTIEEANALGATGTTA